MVGAVQPLFVDLARSPAAREIDWGYWKDAGTDLDFDRPTLTEQQRPVGKGLADAASS
jgi:hypothetical protein